MAFTKNGNTGVALTIAGQTVLAEAGEFSTGSKGYFATGKVVIDGKRYQVSSNLVEIGSKPTSATEAKPKVIRRPAAQTPKAEGDATTK